MGAFRWEVGRGRGKIDILEAIERLEKRGYFFAMEGDGIEVFVPAAGGGKEDGVLLDVIRADKQAALAVLRCHGFVEAMPLDGDLREVTFSASDATTLHRWAAALDAGLIALEGKVLAALNDDRVRVRYRCSFPDAWLQDEITAVCGRMDGLYT